MTVPLDPATRKFLIKVLDDAMDLTIATKREDGFPQATVVSFVHDDDKIYFGCGADSQKARNIAHDNRVSVTVTPPYVDWNHIRGISMGARAYSVTDNKEQARVGELMMKRFPEAEGMEEMMKGFDMALYRIDPEVISILNYEKGFGHTELKTGLAA